MKKLLVLAALSAMAFGAKAEYTWKITDSGLSAVYWLSDLSVSDMGGKDPQEWAGLVWSRPISDDEESFSYDKYLLNAEIATSVTDGETWADRYAVLEGIFSENEFAKNDGTFSYSRSKGESAYWALFALNDADEITPGAEYTVYLGTSDEAGGEIALTKIASGHLMTDGATPAPEPTSGLLLLLGVAGLALKRKRA